MGDILRNNYGYTSMRQFEEQLKKEQIEMNKKNWFELIKAMIVAGLGYLAGIFL